MNKLILLGILATHLLTAGTHATPSLAHAVRTNAALLRIASMSSIARPSALSRVAITYHLADTTYHSVATVLVHDDDARPRRMLTTGNSPGLPLLTEFDYAQDGTSITIVTFVPSSDPTEWAPRSKLTLLSAYPNDPVRFEFAKESSLYTWTALDSQWIKVLDLKTDYAATPGSCPGLVTGMVKTPAQSQWTTSTRWHPTCDTFGRIAELETEQLDLESDNWLRSKDIYTYNDSGLPVSTVSYLQATTAVNLELFSETIYTYTNQPSPVIATSTTLPVRQLRFSTRFDLRGRRLSKSTSTPVCILYSKVVSQCR